MTISSPTAILQASWDPTLLLDAHGRVVDMNEAARDLWPAMDGKTTKKMKKHHSHEHVSQLVELDHSKNQDDDSSSNDWWDDQVLPAMAQPKKKKHHHHHPPEVLRYPQGAVILDHDDKNETAPAKISIASLHPGQQQQQQQQQQPEEEDGDDDEPAFFMFVQVLAPLQQLEQNNKSPSFKTTTQQESFEQRRVSFAQEQKTEAALFSKQIQDDDDSSNNDNNHELLGGLIDSSFDPMFLINEEAHIVMVNKAATDVFGWRKAEFLGRNINMIMPQHHARQHDGYIDHYKKTGLKMVLGRKRNMTAVKKDGREFPIQLGVQERQVQGKTFYCGYVRDRSEVSRSAELLRAMIDASESAMFQINEAGIIELVNRAALTVFGYDKESDFVGKNISMIMTGEDAKHHNLYLSSYLKSGIKRLIGTHRTLTAVKKDGTKFPIQLGLQEALTSTGEKIFCGFVNDRTEAVKEEERMQRHQQLTSGTINAAFDGIFQINSKGIIQMVNQAACDVFGYTRDEFLGTNIAMITGPDHCDKHNSYIARYLQTGERRVIGRRRELRAYRKDGSSFPIELGVNEIKTIWGERVFAGFIRDISRQKFDEENVQEHEKLTSGILDAMLDPLFTIDEHLTIYTANDCASDELGLEEPGDLVGKKLDSFFGETHRKAHKAFLNKHFHYHNRYHGSSSGSEPYGHDLRSTFFMQRSDKTVFETELKLSELDGPFPILLGSVRSEIDDEDQPQQGTRVFSVILRGGKNIGQKTKSWF